MEPEGEQKRDKGEVSEHILLYSDIDRSGIWCLDLGHPTRAVEASEESTSLPEKQPSFQRPDCFPIWKSLPFKPVMVFKGIWAQLTLEGILLLLTFKFSFLFLIPSVHQH